MTPDLDLALEFARDAGMSNSSTGSALSRISAQRSAIAAQRAALEEQDRRLAYLWNTYQAVNRLPAELLVGIFVLPVRNLRGEPPSPFSWMALRLVCRHWDRVACGTPSLWRTIRAPAKIPWLSLCLLRSAEATLDITYLLSRDAALQSFQNSLLPHAARIRSVEVHQYMPKATLHAVAALLDHHMPALETVRIIPALPRRTTLDISHLRHPRVQHVHLRGIRRPVPMEIRLIAGLRLLSLHTCYGAFSADEFLDVLASSTRLEELVLTAFLHGLTGELQPPSTSYREPFAMPHLVSLRVSDHGPATTSTFLSHLCLSAHASIELSGPSKGKAGEQSGVLSMLLPPAPFRASFTPILGPSLMVEEVSLSACLVHYALEATRRDGSHGSLSLRKSSAPDRNDEFLLLRGLSELLQIFRTAPLTCLAITGFIGVCAPAAGVWDALFATFPALESLSLSNVGHLLPFWSALGGRGDDTGAGGPRFLPCAVHSGACHVSNSATRYSRPMNSSTTCSIAFDGGRSKVYGCDTSSWAMSCRTGDAWVRVEIPTYPAFEHWWMR